MNGNYVVIIGGQNNSIADSSAINSAILGGYGNVINNSDYSVVAGYKAQADHDGVFIFSGYDPAVDETSVDPYITSKADSQFLVYAKNGVGIGTNDVSSEEGITFSSIDGDLVLKENSLRVAGDIVAVDNGYYGYLIGDGRYLSKYK